MKAIFSILIVVLFSCNKSLESCSCYESHEERQTVSNGNGGVSLVWVHTVNTTEQPDLCSKETGDYVYTNSNTTERYKVICN